MHRFSGVFPAGWFWCKKDKTGFDFRKEGAFQPCLYFLLKWDGLQTPEMQSRLRALPFLTGLTRGRSLPPPEHASQPLIRPDQTVESISQRFLSLLITPSQPARPIDRRLIGEWIGVEMVQSCRNESFVCFLNQWLGGRRSAPYFQPLQLVLTSFAIRTDTKKNAGDSSEMQKRIRLIPDPELMTQPQICWMKGDGLLTLSH